jgi:hypothetical protein
LARVSSKKLKEKLKEKRVTPLRKEELLVFDEMFHAAAEESAAA